jgi:hypothetical protein
MTGAMHDFQFGRCAGHQIPTALQCCTVRGAKGLHVGTYRKQKTEVVTERWVAPGTPGNTAEGPRTRSSGIRWIAAS